MECFVKALLQLWGWETLVQTDLMDNILYSLWCDDVKQTAMFRCYSVASSRDRAGSLFYTVMHHLLSYSTALGFLGVLHELEAEYTLVNTCPPCIYAVFPKRDLYFFLLTVIASSVSAASEIHA